MGCASSKADDLPLVALCRERTELLRSAADHRYVLAAAHASYFRALDRVGDALHRFAVEELVTGSASPILTLPLSEGKPPRFKSGGWSTVKGENASDANISSPPSPPSSTISTFSGSHLDGECHHLHRPSGSDSEESFGRRKSRGGDGKGWKSFPHSVPFPAFVNENCYYMKAAPTISSTVYQDPRFEVWFNEQSQRIGYGYDYGYGYDFPSYVQDGTFSFEPPGMSRSHEALVAPASEVTRPQPSPPPPQVSPWDFFNPFDSYEQIFDGYAKSKFSLGSDVSSPNSSEVREQEGIPDLEEETEQESVKGTGNRSVLEEKRIVSDDSDRFNSSVGSSKAVAAPCENEKDSAMPEDQEDKNGMLGGGNLRNSGEIKEMEQRKERLRFDENKGVVMEDSGWGSNALLSVPRTKDVLEAVKEITEQFKTAASCGKDVSRILEVGKIQYRPSIRIFKGASMLKMDEAVCAGFEKYISESSSHLSSTLEQLYMWEKKLYKEVKDEEKLRLFYEREYNRLKALDDKGAESDKIDSSRTALKRLIMKISMTIKSVHAISWRIHKLRDEELWPQLVELIHGLIRMWSCMLDCHRRQFQSIFGACSQKYIVKFVPPQSLTAKATSDLELELINWCSCFSNWIRAQKAYIEKLNGCLMKWLLQEQEDPSDGIAPLSPGKIGAPTIFIITNDWHHITEKTSEDKVLEAMHAFARNLHKLCESQDEEQQQKLKAEYLSKDFERRLKTLENRNMEGKHPDASDKITTSASGNDIPGLNGGMIGLDLMRKRSDEEKAKHVEAMKQIQEVASCSLKTGLIPIFEALEKYCSEMLKRSMIPDHG